MKRKGSVITSAPCSVVVSSPKDIPISPEAAMSDGAEGPAPSSQLLLPHFTSPAPVGMRIGEDVVSGTSFGTSRNIGSWEDTLTMMDNFLSSHQKQVEDENVENVKLVAECQSILESLENDAREKTLSEFSRVKTELQSQIEKAEESFRNENEDLLRHEQHLRQLEEELVGLRTQQEELLDQKRNVLDRIEEYKRECSEDIEKIDEIEADRISEVPRMKRLISLYASCTGIKWNYDNTNVLEGEVSFPSAKEIRLFSVDPDGLSEFEVANRIWDVISASSHISAVNT